MRALQWTRGPTPPHVHKRNSSSSLKGEGNTSLHGSFIASPWVARPDNGATDGTDDNFSRGTSDYCVAPLLASRYMNPASTRSTRAQRQAQGRAAPTCKSDNQPPNRRCCPTKPADGVTARRSSLLPSDSRTKITDIIINPQKGEDMSLDRHSFGDGAA